MLLMLTFTNHLSSRLADLLVNAMTLSELSSKQQLARIIHQGLLSSSMKQHATEQQPDVKWGGLELDNEHDCTITLYEVKGWCRFLLRMSDCNLQHILLDTPFSLQFHSMVSFIWTF
jgi:hypothetical protein